MSKKFLILLFLIPFQLMFAQKSLLKDFPEGYTPKEIGKRIAYRFLTENTRFMLVNGLAIRKPSIGVAPCDMLMERKTKSLFNVYKKSLISCLPKRRFYNLL